MIQSEHPMPKSVGGQKTVPTCANCHAKKTISHDFKLFGWKGKLGSYRIPTKCAVCGYTGLIGVDMKFHHILPRTLGGSDTPINVMMLCANHHVITDVKPKVKGPKIPAQDQRWGYEFRCLRYGERVIRLWSKIMAIEKPTQEDVEYVREEFVIMMKEIEQECRSS